MHEGGSLMALDFPAAPTVGQKFDDWTWDGTKWALTAITGGSSGALPVGAIIDFYGASAPSGFLACNGATFDGLVYPELQVLLGGTTLPDLRDRSTIGVSGTAALGIKKGAADATVSQHQHASTLAAPAHTHNINPPSTATAADAHTHTTSSMKLGAQGTTNFGFTIASGATGPTANSNNASSSDSHTHTVDIAAFTSGAESATALTGAVGNVSGVTVAAAGANYHPVMAVLKCIKAVP
jgi:microcystin-dependent protein